ncbi:hypothetical protein Ddc_15608 [Ditylenchus destructor]|nr:hypothetical protein Ddc_15608 [Ditylenchus destructor]
MILSPPQNRQGRAVSVGACIGEASATERDSAPKRPSSGNVAPLEIRKTSACGPNTLGIEGSPYAAHSRMRRRSTRRRLSQVQKAVNFNEWSNKKYVYIFY